MELGFLTDCLPRWTLERLVGWAADNGFAALELAAWPALPGATHGSHVPADLGAPGAAARVRDLLAANGLACSSLAYYANPLHPDPAVRTAVLEHLRHCIAAAALIGCPTVGTFVGRDPARSVAENAATAEPLLLALVEEAGERDVTLVVENCPMAGWHPDGYPGNVAYSPELWEWLVTLGVRLNFDPSHLPTLGVDPVRAARRFAPWVAHVQAKDVELDPVARDDHGWPGPALRRRAGDHGWWRYRVPGHGSLDWPAILAALRAGGYDGVVSVEHEDPVLRGDDANITEGLRVARDTLTPLLA